MKKIILKSSIFSLLSVLLFQSCTKKLDLQPTNDVTSEVVYSTPTGYKQVLAKVYGAFALTGNQGPAGNGDVQGIDEGFSDFFRLFWKAQELSTDEAVIAWGDVGIQVSSQAFTIVVYTKSPYAMTSFVKLLMQSLVQEVFPAPTLIISASMPERQGFSGLFSTGC
jgi:hypothetical protein